MTNNPTIDGVSRSTIEAIIGDMGTKAYVDAWKELRAMLDAPSCKTCQDDGYVGHMLDMHPCPDCAALAPAVERQEPVCATCNGTKMVDDGEINHYPDGTPYSCGPVKCIKDCPDCQGAPELAALQSTIAQLQVRVQELESGSEPVGRVSYIGSGFVRVRTTECLAMEQLLFAAPSAPVAAVLPDRDLLRDKIAEAIGGDTYDCTRVWSAWGVGTMDQDDFVSLVEQEDRLYEIVDACLDATAALKGGRK